MSSSRKAPRKRLGKGLSAILDTTAASHKHRPVQVGVETVQTTDSKEDTNPAPEAATSAQELSDVQTAAAVGDRPAAPATREGSSTTSSPR